MTPHDVVPEANGSAGWSRWFAPAPSPFPPPGAPDRLASALHLARGPGTGLARLNTRQPRRAPGTPGTWTRFVAAHVRWIMAVTLTAGGGAWALAHSQTPVFRSGAEVVVEPTVAEASTLQAPDMATEKGLVSSGAVVAKAARTLNVPQGDIARGLSVTVPASTYLLQIFHSDPNPKVAQQRAQAVAQAYVSYRSPKPAAARKLAKTPAVTAAPTAALITPASLPTSPASPKYLVDIVVALVLGLGLGLATAGIRDHLDDRLRGPLDLEAHAGLRVLALIPAFRAAMADPTSRLAVVRSPDSVVAEAYRDLRTRLFARRPPRTVVVTSPAWEHKGTVAANLAAVLAQSGWTTVLVCADVRWGRTHELFGLKRDAGLTAVLDQRTDLRSALRTTGIPGLRVLPPGQVPSDPSGMLGRPAWRAMAGELCGHADAVIIEAPPLLATPDAGFIAEVAAKILLVADARRTARAQMVTAMLELEHMPGKLAGCVLDNVGRRRILPRTRPVPAGDLADATWWHPADVRGAGLYGGKGFQSANHAARPGSAPAAGTREITREDIDD